VASNGSKIYFKIFFQRHILRSQAYGWIGIRKIWVFSKQSSNVDERVKVRIFKIQVFIKALERDTPCKFGKKYTLNAYTAGG
jgi:hypothetical protein